jgi:hypothetical protein
MTHRSRVVARTDFASARSQELSGTHPAVDAGVVHRGTELWSDDPLVVASPTMFVDADVIPRHQEGFEELAPTRPTGADWIALVRAHRRTDQRRPKLLTVAEQMGWDSEQPLRDLCRRLGIKDWRDVHGLVASELD